ncbi:hypothetical protein BDF21DRAFT_406311 [Thamnidium elegans]|nr:hypothetical protein BDF21DRAFT_406311 [Thamnidium elegans]
MVQTSSLTGSSLSSSSLTSASSRFPSSEEIAMLLTFTCSLKGTLGPAYFKDVPKSLRVWSGSSSRTTLNITLPLWSTSRLAVTPSKRRPGALKLKRPKRSCGALAFFKK